MTTTHAQIPQAVDPRPHSHSLSEPCEEKSCIHFKSFPCFECGELITKNDAAYWNHNLPIEQQGWRCNDCHFK